MSRHIAAKAGILLVITSLAVVIAVAAFRSGEEDMQLYDLGKLIDRADRLVVLEEPMEGADVLFESSNRPDLDSLKAALRVEQPQEDVHCMCIGSPSIELFANGKKIGEVTNHHAKLIRCSSWESDAPIVDVETFLKWFDDRKILGPRQEYEEGLERQRKSQAEERKWIAAIPVALRPLWPATDGQFEPDLDALRRPLAKQFPEKRDRILALFAWYGSGTGPWSGFPSYETIPEELLLDYSTAELLAAMEGTDLTETQMEGAARLFGGWTFSQLRQRDRHLLPAELQARLLKHSLKTEDEDKRSRAQNAFGRS